MDLPTCPACKQSVLDDDAVDCPFCGAPMKGGGGPGRSGAATAPARSAPAKSSPPARLDTSKGTGSTAADKQRPGGTRDEGPKKASPPADDDPFAVDNSAAAKAIAVSAKAAPGKTLEVKCPMCETPGFVSPKAAGQLVRCCNPKCLVPTFTVPAPKKAEAAPTPPPAKKSPTLLYGGIAVATLLIGGGLVWHFSGPPAPPSPPTGSGTAITTTMSGNDQGALAPPIDGGPAKQGDEPTKGTTLAADPRAELTSQALRKLVEVSFTAPSIRKAYCRRMAAIGYAESGDVKEALDQIDQLLKVSKNTPYEACLPRTLIAWRQRVASPTEFDASVAEAQRLAGSLPQRGRYAVECGIATAALLAASGKLDDGRKMLAAHQGTAQVNQLAGALQVVLQDGTFDLDGELIGRGWGDWMAPQETAVTLILASHGLWDEAQRWAEGISDPAAQAESTLAWAEALARAELASAPGADLNRAKTAADKLPPAVKARLLARLASLQIAHGNTAQATALAGEALTLLQGNAPPASPKPTTAKAILDLKLPAALGLRQSALAAADLALVQSALQQREPAWNSIQLALRFLRGSAPPLGLMQQRMAQLEGTGAESIRAELKKDFQLKTDDQMRLKFGEYRTKCGELFRAAHQRLVWQADILNRTAREGMLDQVWDEVRRVEARTDATERELYLATELSGWLARLFLAAGQEDQRAEVADLTEKRAGFTSPELHVRALEAYLEQINEPQEISATARPLNAELADGGLLHEAPLRLACRLAKAGRTQEAIQFSGQLKDTVLREDGLFVVAALAARTGHAAEAWSIISAATTHSEIAAACAGLTAGLSRSAPAASP
ncbi:MAG: hypothetical protein ACKV0T_19490 [Planctomycetales bacterium]